jgi:hypothetical protein
MTLSRHACPLALAALLLAAFPASAAAPNGGWKGKTEQGSTLNMTIKQGKVTRFSANVNMFCTNGGGLKSRVLYHDRPVAIRDRRFKFKGEAKDGSSYEFAGRIARGKERASGTLGYHDGYYGPSGLSFCNANDVKWTAKRR